MLASEYRSQPELFICLSIYPPSVYTRVMPLFEYVCTECGQADERLVHAPAPEQVLCAACGGQASRQVPLLARSAGDCAPTSSGGT